MKKEGEDESENEKIPKKLNDILIERIRKYEIQDTSQLVNGPNDGDTNTFYLGGLINFDGENDNNSSNNQFDNTDFDKITENDIYMQPYEYNDYNELEEEEEDEEIEENDKEKGNNSNIKNKNDKNVEKDKNIEKENIKIKILKKKI